MKQNIEDFYLGSGRMDWRDREQTEEGNSRSERTTLALATHHRDPPAFLSLPAAA